VAFFTLCLRFINDMAKEKSLLVVKSGAIFYFSFSAVLSDYFSLGNKLYQKQIKCA